MNQATQWTPNMQALEAIVRLLQSTTSPDNNVQRTVVSKIKEFKQNPEFSMYLSFVLSQCTAQQVGGNYVRFQAGVILKTIVSRPNSGWSQLNPNIRNYVVAQIMTPSAIGDATFNVRKTIANVLANIVSKQKQPPALQTWPSLLPTLVAMMTQSANNLPLLDGSTQCLSLLCEDCGWEILRHDDKPFNTMVPFLIQLTTHNDQGIRQRSLECLVNIIPLGCAAIDLHMQTLLTALSARTTDPDPIVRVAVCQALTEIVEQHLVNIVPMLGSIFQFFLHATMNDPDETVALQACTFWQMYCDNCGECRDALKTVLPQLVPALLNRMVYSEEELVGLPVDDMDDMNVPDNQRDIRPTFHTNKSGAATLADDEGDEDEEQGEHSHAETWTLRKSAAAALDALGEVWGNDLLPHLLAPLKALLGSGDDTNWLRVESGILALGCVSRGCEQIVQYMGDLYPMLLRWSGHPRPLIRKISLWSMSKYTKWLLYTARKRAQGDLAQQQQQQQPPPPHTSSSSSPTTASISSSPSHTALPGIDFLQLTIQCYCQRMVDHTKIVQGAATSSLGLLAEQAKQDNCVQLILPYAQPMLQTCVQCLNSYQERNMVLVCDTMAFVIECCKSRHDVVRSPQFLQMMMPPLIARWNSLKQAEDHQYVPIMEGMTSVAAAVGPGFEPFAPPVFSKCLDIIETAMIVVLGSEEAGEDCFDYIDVDPMCVALDLVAGIAEGLGNSFSTLLNASNFSDLLVHALKYHDLDVQQSSFGCLGEIGKACPQFIVSHLPHIIPECMRAMSSATMSSALAGGYTAEGEDDEDDYVDADGDEVTNVCNNAIWCVGEIVLKVGPTPMQQFLGPILNKLVGYVLSSSTDKVGVPIPESVRTNSAITIGRLAMVAPQPVGGALGQGLANFVKKWCLVIMEMPDDEEKVDACLGVTLVAKAYPQALVADAKTLGFLAHAFLSWDPDIANGLNNGLIEQFRALFQGFANSMGQQGWHQLKMSWGGGAAAGLRDKLMAAFGV